MPRYELVPTPFDDLRTNTSASQVSTEIDISTQLHRWLDVKDDEKQNRYQPVDSVLLTRSSHISYLYPLFFNLAGHFACLDSSRAWIIYWIVGAFSVLEARLKEDERLRAIRTIMSCQHPEGGFGGGPGQMAHLASTYACIAALSILLDGADQNVVDETLAKIDRNKMLQWMLSLKMPDGSFTMHHGGEIDVRSCFGALTVATILNLLTPELVQNIPEYLVSCQTYEGGLCASSLPNKFSHEPDGTQPEMPSAAPVGEAHGGYNSCALACDFLVQGLPSLSGSPRLDYDACLRWAAQMQGLPIEGGGFRGRTNKLVDGCYSWWCAGAFPVLRALMTSDFPDQQESFDLFDRQALQEYILLVSQDLTSKAKQGGLRDKPSAKADMYHTHYILAGLSLAQHSQKHSRQRLEELKASFKTPDYSKCIIGNSESQDEAFERMKEIYSRALAWEVEEDKDLVVGLVSNKVLPVHPVLNIKHVAVERMMKYFYDQQ